MQPQHDPYTIDYLNQIAPQQHSGGPSRRTIIIIGALSAVALIVAAMLMIMSAQGPGDSSQLMGIKARIATLQTIADKRQRLLEDTSLRATNSSLSAFLKTANAEIEAPMTRAGLKPNVTDKTTTSRETALADELNQKLDDAQLNGILDRVYASEMNYQIQALSNNMYKLYTSTRSAALRDYLVSTDKSLEPIKDKLKNFSNNSA